MAVVTYTQNAVLGAYQQWLMQQGAQACLERRTIGQDALDCAIQQGMVRAQAGSLLRYSVLTTLASANVFFAGQFLSDVGMWQNVGETVTGTSAGGIDQVIRPATAGCYKNMVASVGTAVVAGSEVYVLVELGRTNNGQFTPYAVLLSGYVRTNEPIDSGGGPQINNPPTASGGGGCCITSLVSDEMQGTTSISHTVTVPSGANGRLVNINGTVVTAAPVANRLLGLLIDNNTNYLFNADGQAEQAAGVTRAYFFVIGGLRYISTPTGTEYGTLPADLWFDSSFNITLQLRNVQTGDNFGIWAVTSELRGA